MPNANTDFYGGKREWSDLSDESDLSDKTRTASKGTRSQESTNRIPAQG